jgi:predicted CoA-binding protein
VSNIIPIRPTSKADVDDAAVSEQVDQIPGELDVDRVIKAQLSSPEVVRRITELEDCLWAVTAELLKFDARSSAAERARLLLKNSLEIDDSRG